MSVEAIGGTAAEGNENTEGALPYGHMVSLPAWAGASRAATAIGGFGDGTMTTAPHCSHSEVMMLCKFN